MAKRLSDTNAIAGTPYDAGEDHNISVRKIDNGFMVRQSSCDPMTGEYKSSEAYYKERPRVLAPKIFRGASPDMGEGGLRDTMNYLNNDK